MTSEAPPVLAVTTRSGMVENVHRGTAVIVDRDGSIVASWGDPQRAIFPRSSNKPFQAAAMVRLGLDLPDDLLALAAASHSGERFHLVGVRRILELAGLTEDDLRTPADYPLDPFERDAWVAGGRGPTPIAMNCSGKHAAMLATCVASGWPTDDYRSVDHPLQAAIRDYLEGLSGERIAHVGIDGCGAPVLALTVAGLARSLSSAVTSEPASPAGRVVAAMREYPEFVGGDNRDVTSFMRDVPGLAAKDGAAGVYVLALADGTATAVKIDDGSEPARQVVVAALLGRMGVDPALVAGLATIPIHGGGAVVGEVAAAI